MYKTRRKLYQACSLRQWRDFTSKAIELTITTHCIDFCGFAIVSNFDTHGKVNFIKDQIFITLAILRRSMQRVTEPISAPVQHNFEWRASHADSDVCNHYAKQLV